MSERVERGDPRLHVEDIKYTGETGDIHAQYARPKGDDKLPGVLVISEVWGLVPHIEDVARRVALEGFLALAPDPLSHLGGTPDDAEEAVKMMRGLDAEETTKNLVAAVEYLKTYPQSTGKVGVTGFCWGGGMTNQVAVNTPDVPSVQAHYAGDDERINAGIPAFEAALKEAGVEHEIHIYEGAKHGFYNDTSQRYHEEAAKLAWGRTMALFKEKLKT
jgi:carboxymethylenebutenolidase